MKRSVRWSGALALAFLPWVGGCALHTGAVVAPAAAPVPPPLACRDIQGLDALLTPGAGVLFGEMHGTAEIPAFLANAACLALRAERPVTVALEMPREDQARVDAFLATAGSEADRRALLASPFWTAEYQDGRRSQAMLNLLDEIRRRQREGRKIRVKLVDRLDMPASPMERDRWMGEALAEAFGETPGGVVIALLGNLHTRISRGSPWDPDYEPTGFVLTNLKPELKVVSLDFSSPRGTAWFCTAADAASCQVRPAGGRKDAAVDQVVLHPQVTNGHSGSYGVGSLTASPPARKEN